VQRQFVDGLPRDGRRVVVAASDFAAATAVTTAAGRRGQVLGHLLVERGRRVQMMVLVVLMMVRREVSAREFRHGYCGRRGHRSRRGRRLLIAGRRRQGRSGGGRGRPVARGLRLVLRQQVAHRVRYRFRSTRAAVRRFLLHHCFGLTARTVLVVRMLFHVQRPANKHNENM